MNRKSLGICFVGNFDASRVPDRQWRKGVQLVRCLMELFNINEDHILGHREAVGDNRSCPGEYFNMDAFRREVSVL